MSFTKADWLEEIIDGKRSLILFARIFDIILYTVLQTFIGLRSLSFEGDYTLGIRTIFASLIIKKILDNKNHILLNHRPIGREE